MDESFWKVNQNYEEPLVTFKDDHFQIWNESCLKQNLNVKLMNKFTKQYKKLILNKLCWEKFRGKGLEMNE